MRTPRIRFTAAFAIATIAALGAVATFTPPPDDPGFAPDPACPPGGPALPNPACHNPSGQWNLLSYWFNNAPDPGHPSGISADLAWSVTPGRRDTVVVVLDSGVNYDRDDLANKIWLSCGELPAPQDAGGSTMPGSSPGCREPGSVYDLDGNGYFNIQDYASDPRVPNSVATAAKTRGDLRPFENGIDDDANGFVDDVSGWDARDGDGDEYRTTGDGHGTGRNGIVGAEGDNGIGLVGVCPECTLANVRVDATFVTRTEGPAIGALWAADHGFEVINMALGATSGSSMSRAAFDYFTRHNGLALNASANEFSFHQNFQTVFDDVMAIGAVVPDNDLVQGNPSPLPTTTYLRKANFSNYGAHLDVVTPSDTPTTGGGNTGGYGDSSGTSSAVPHASGVAGLVFSRARELIDANVLDTSPLALKDISAQEVRQIINRTADDITVTDDPGGAGAYPYLTGWDRWTGYGRVNALAAVQRVGAGTIPPEADINSPDWYRKVGRTDPLVTVALYANARWTSSYDWVLEVGAGIEPASFTAIDSASGASSDPSLSSASLVSNLSRTWDTTGLPEGFYTLRLRVTDDLGNEGEDRMGVWIQRADPQDHSGWPQTIAGVDGVRPTSLDSIGSALVDLDGDNTLEIIVSSGDGVIHAFRESGAELPGWPVRSDDVEPLPLAQSDAFDGNPANGEIAVASSSVVGGVSVGDIDADTVQEVCASAYNGKVYCWDATGALEPGFPVETDKGITRDQYPPFADELNAHGAAVLAPPALADLDDDGTLELLAGSFDQKMYVWNHDGTRYAPWPKAIYDASQVTGVNTANPKAIISVPIVADIDLDGTKELVFGTNETYGSTPTQSGRLYAYDANGNLEPGWPVEVGPSPSANPVPLVAEGVGTSPVAADLDGDGELEIATGVFLSPPQIFRSDGSQFALMSAAPGSPGGATDDGDEETPEGGLGVQPALYYVALGAFADLEGLGELSYLNGSLGLGVGTLAIGSGELAPLDFHLSAWDATSGAQKPAFPRLLEDWQFFTGPAVADLDGAAGGTPEIVVSSGGYFVHAFNGVTGLEPAGWPKNVGHWVVATPLVGDIDGDADLEVVVATRMGDLHVWDMPGAACRTPLVGGPSVSTAQWRKALHDEWGTGTYGRDTLRPAAIDDLAQPSDGNLTFTGVGDDGRCGDSTTYEVRSLPGTVQPNWAVGAVETQVAGSADGVPQAISIGTSPSLRTLMVRAFDEAGNGTPVAVNFPEPSRSVGLVAAIALLGCLSRRRS